MLISTFYFPCSLLSALSALLIKYSQQHCKGGTIIFPVTDEVSTELMLKVTQQLVSGFKPTQSGSRHHILYYNQQFARYFSFMDHF